MLAMRPAVPAGSLVCLLLLQAAGCAHTSATTANADDSDRVLALEAEVRDLRRALAVASAPLERTVVTPAAPSEEVLGTLPSSEAPDEASTESEPTEPGDTSGGRVVLRLHEAAPLPVVTERLPVVEMAPLPATPVPAASPAAGAQAASNPNPATRAALPPTEGASSDAVIPAAYSPNPPVAAYAPPAAATPDEELTLYREGLAHLTARRYEAAVSSIGAFLRDHPGSPRADDAMYFRATANYALRRYRDALVDYERVLRIAPDGDRAADALFHSALCHRRLGQEPRAVELLARLRQRYPESVAARLAAREDSI